MLPLLVVARISSLAADLALSYADGEIVLESGPAAESGASVLELRRSGDLVSWEEVGRFQEQLYPYALSVKSEPASVFFQASHRRPTVRDDWANQLLVPSSGLIAQALGGGLSGAPFAKFTIALTDLERVYFQDSSKFPFHYSFIRERLPGYEDLGFLDFERVALRKEGQELALGTVLLAPDPSVAELAIQFAGQEAFDVEDVIRWFQATIRRLALEEQGARVFYMPTFEQRDVSFANEAQFAAAGIRLDTPTRWASEPVCYSQGWALGRFRFVPATEIDAAYGDGRLGVRDILVTDFVPAEVPLVAGIISFQPATPNSHVVLLARSSDVPMAFASGEALQEQIRAWEGQEFLLTVSNSDGGCDFGFQNVEGKLSDEERAAIWALKERPQVTIQAKAPADQLWLSTEDLERDAIRFVGGKAANFGYLRRSIPEYSPESIAFTFDLWDAFMAQATGEGGSLRRWIAETLAPFDHYPPDVPQLRGALALIQDRIKEQTLFSSELREGVVAALQGFDPGRKLRFRSSTNVEDSDQFSGAGLYDSFSGCLLDDLDANTSGPSHCDSSKSKERGVFRAIRKVFASFYNENAFLERLRHGVNESDVGMALLVHHSFPDPLELANGVATLEIQRAEDGERQVRATLVTQWGAVSVANPDSTVLPEVVEFDGTQLDWTAASSLVPAGKTVMEWEVDYRDLLALLDRAAQAFETSFEENDHLLLDFEYKKMAESGLVVKQIRMIPQPAPVPPPTIE